MNYYYDLILNFQDNNIYEFYEWEEDDPIERVKKIPLFRVDSHTFNNFIKYNVQVHEDFYKLITDRTLLSNNQTVKYAFIISDAKNSLAIELNEQGQIAYLSKLQIADDLNINELIYNLKETTITYEVYEERKIRENLRQEEIIRNIISLEIDTLKKENNNLKLEYLYSEWFNEVETNLDIIITKMQNELTKDINNDHYRVYELIRLSYKKSSLSN